VRHIFWPRLRTHVFVSLDVVAAVTARRSENPVPCWPGGAHLMVVLFDSQPQAWAMSAAFHCDVLEGVVWSDREITSLPEDFVGQVALPRVALSSSPSVSIEIHGCEQPTGAGVVTAVVEQKEFRLRGEEGPYQPRPVHPGRPRACCRAIERGSAHRARRCAGLDGADQAEGAGWPGRRDRSGRRVTPAPSHIRFVDRLPAPDRRAIEGDAGPVKLAASHQVRGQWCGGCHCRAASLIWEIDHSILLEARHLGQEPSAAGAWAGREGASGGVLGLASLVKTTRTGRQSGNQAKGHA